MTAAAHRSSNGPTTSELTRPQGPEVGRNQAGQERTRTEGSGSARAQRMIMLETILWKRQFRRRAGAEAKAHDAPATSRQLRQRACAGLALLEALVAAALLATGAAGLIRLQARLAWAGEEIRHQGEALWLAQQALEQGRDSLQVTPGRWTGRTTTFDLQGDASATTPDGLPASSAPSPAPALADPFPLRSLRVHVSWTDRHGQPQSLDLHTLVPSANRSLTAWLTRADG